MALWSFNPRLNTTDCRFYWTAFTPEAERTEIPVPRPLGQLVFLVHRCKIATFELDVISSRVIPSTLKNTIHFLFVCLCKRDTRPIKVILIQSALRWALRLPFSAHFSRPRPYCLTTVCTRRQANVSQSRYK